MVRPLNSNSLTCGSSSASSACSAPSRRIRQFFQTPRQRLLLSKKPTPNMFFSLTHTKLGGKVMKRRPSQPSRRRKDVNRLEDIPIIGPALPAVCFLYHHI